MVWPGCNGLVPGQEDVQAFCPILPPEPAGEQVSWPADWLQLVIVTQVIMYSGT